MPSCRQEESVKEENEDDSEMERKIQKLLQV